MAGGYWQELKSRRLARRRALKAGAGLGVAAAAFSLIGCGGDGGGDGQLGDQSGLIHTPKETGGKAGGTLKHYVTADILHFDATADPSATTVALSSEPFYPRLLKVKTEKYPGEADGTSIGDAAESWEISGDRLQVTFKLRQGMKWDARAPTSGRVLDAQDVLYSWNKFGSVNSLATTLVYDASKAP